MITSGQIKAARDLLGITTTKLAEMSGVAFTTIIRIESSNGIPSGQVKTLNAVQKALEEGGVLTQVAVLERETPQYVDGKTDQVALKFRLKANWPLLIPAKAPAAGGSK